MAEICCGVVSENETSTRCEPTSRAARRRRMEIRKFKFIAGVAVPENGSKRRKLDVCHETSPRECKNAIQNFLDVVESRLEAASDASDTNDSPSSNQLLKPVNKCLDLCTTPEALSVAPELVGDRPKFGMTSVCGRRRDMEDAVATQPSFCRPDPRSPAKLHFFGLYDGHGCSHVAMKCKDRLHELVKEELESGEASIEWNEAMERSFSRMDKEVLASSEGKKSANCRCELQTPQCDAVGSTAVVSIVTPNEIVVANCGDSRAVLCRKGKAVPLTTDHKPDRPDELERIQAAGGRVIYWDGPRVLGVLAMSRAIGDNYLKPYVISEPEVTITERTAEDDCLILASDGLWDVVSAETACGIARMCLRGQIPSPLGCEASNAVAGEKTDKACSDASMLLTKLALARHSSDNVSVIVVDLRRQT